jgi:dihydrofolate synthase/folylpolyglutamate synthase
VETAHELGLPAQPSPDVERALSAIKNFDLQPSPRILITGSLYLAGAVLAANGTPPA